MAATSVLFSTPCVCANQFPTGLLSPPPSVSLSSVCFPFPLVVSTLPRPLGSPTPSRGFGQFLCSSQRRKTIPNPGKRQQEGEEKGISPADLDAFSLERENMKMKLCGSRPLTVADRIKFSTQRKKKKKKKKKKIRVKNMKGRGRSEVSLKRKNRKRRRKQRRFRRKLRAILGFLPPPPSFSS